MANLKKTGIQTAQNRAGVSDAGAQVHHRQRAGAQTRRAFWMRL
jgi:hypothetical protein